MHGETLKVVLIYCLYFRVIKLLFYRK